MIILPQMPSQNRYTEFWLEMWERELKKLGIPFSMIGGRNISPLDRSKPFNWFCDTKKAIRYELSQIISLLDHIEDKEKILWLDASFPGFSVNASQLMKRMNPNLKIFAYVHAGSWCKGDIWSAIESKKQAELSALSIFDKIFVSTFYHKKLMQSSLDFNSYSLMKELKNKIKIVGIPYYTKDIPKIVRDTSVKKPKILIIGRGEQSDTDMMDRYIRNVGTRWEIVNKAFGSRLDYLKELSTCKLAVSFKTEETFGLSTLDALSLGTFPLCPNRCAYLEVLDNLKFLYQNEQSLMEKTLSLMKSDINTEELKKHSVFYGCKLCIPKICYEIESS